jgi:hypothetical protein
MALRLMGSLPALQPLKNTGAPLDGVTPGVASHRKHWAAGRLLTWCRWGWRFA